MTDRYTDCQHERGCNAAVRKVGSEVYRAETVHHFYQCPKCGRVSQAVTPCEPITPIGARGKPTVRNWT